MKMRKKVKKELKELLKKQLKLLQNKLNYEVFNCRIGQHRL
jgi:mRNA-degrading endonuclease RelE of RelBE toxin-antitoxin system